MNGKAAPDTKSVPSTPKRIALFGHVRWEHMAAGVSGGVVSTLVLHPLDLVKVRFQGNSTSAK